MPSIVLITHDNDRHFYFANKICESFPKTRVILSAKCINRSFMQKLKLKLRFPLCSFRNFLLNLAFFSYKERLKRQKLKAESHYFNGEKNKFFSHFSLNLLSSVESSDYSVNDQRFVEMIEALKPDIIVVMGSCLISKKLINTSNNVLNIHTGLSPYYRGGLSNLWPIINSEPEALGVTLHKMSAGIDSGEIVHSRAVKFSPLKGFPVANCEALMVGVDLAIKAINDLDNAVMESIPQWCRGKIYNNRDYNGLVAFKYFSRLRYFARNDPTNRNLLSYLLVNNGKICNEC